jgi:hypothetical protein
MRHCGDADGSGLHAGRNVMLKERLAACAIAKRTKVAHERNIRLAE